jgi:endonuclease/exonuclease/phosphatase family metal-dependent hydrolase
MFTESSVEFKKHFDSTGMNIAQFKFPNSSQCNVILTSHKIINSKSIMLQSGWQKRVLGYAKIKVGNKRVNLLVAHLALGKDARIKQLRFISDFINTLKGPIIFGGDLNTDDKKELNILCNAKLFLASKMMRTFPSWKALNGGGRAFDHVFVRNLSWIHASILKENISDHTGLVIKFRNIY